MEIKVNQGSLTEAKCDVLIINLFEGVKSPGGGTGAVDNALGGLISSYVIEKEGFKGKFGEMYVLQTFGKIPADKVLVVGLGKSSEFNLNKIRELSSKAVNKALSLKAKTVCSILHGAGTAGLSAFDCAQMIAEGAVIGSYKFDKYKSKKDPDENSTAIENFAIVEMNEAKIPEIQKGVEKGQIIAEAVNFARDLANEPPVYLTPSKFAEIANESEGLECKIYEKDELEQMGMNAFLSVGKGSSQPPKFVHMIYKPVNPSKKVALIGKGITFDSGGLDIKPPSSMKTMKGDMSGAAAVLSVMKSLVKLKPDIEVHGITALCENMPGSSAYKPDDILRAKNGKTIEVDNTDAEGRLTLADALSYAVELKPDEMIDVATLTGACVVALGKIASGIFGTDKKLVDNLIEAGEKGGERLWQLPIYEEYLEGLKSSIADFKNSGGREAGASTAAIFLKEFVGEVPWAHIDIAGTDNLEKDYKELSKGFTGVSVRTLINYLIN